MKVSKFLSLNVQDFLKGLVVAIGGAVVAVVAPSIQSGIWTFDWATIWHTAAASALAYLAKNFLTPTPKTVQIDPSKTSVIDRDTKEPLINAN